LIVDVACGTGYGSAMLAGPGRRVIGIDASAEAIREADRNYASSAVSFMVGDATRLTLPSASVDAIVSFETIEHLDDPGQFVAEMARVLRSKGTVLLSTPDRDVYSRGRSDGRSDNPFHPSEMTRAELLEALQTRLVVRELLGQSQSRDVRTTPGARRPGRSSETTWRMAKHAIRRLTAPVLRNDQIAHRLFPLVRRQYLPTHSAPGEHSYIVVRAEKP
jgi:SAM-dependent methyltransferase